MKRPSSKLGLALAALYLSFTLWMIFYALTCSGMFCGISLLLPTYPWLYLWGEMLEGSGRLQTVLVYSCLAISYGLNTLLLYKIGKAMGKAFSHQPFR